MSEGIILTMKSMDFFKATDGIHWYISIDGGDNFELCQREPFLNDKLASPLDQIPLHDTLDDHPEVSLSRQQVEARAFTISKVTSR